MPPQGEVDGTPGEFSWSEIVKHNTEESTWVVIKGEVYDVTNWKNKHPGGNKVLMDSAGQDCSIPFRMLHFDLELTDKYMKVYKIGQVEKTKDLARERWEKLDEEYERLTEIANDMKLFEPNLKFWFLEAYFIWTMAFASMLIFPLVGLNWYTFILSTVLMGIGQVVGVHQHHSLGHKACTHTKVDRWVQILQWNILSGFSQSFWTDFHSAHHIKPNMLEKDPGISVNESLFVTGTKSAEDRAKRDIERGYTIVPYHWQHIYFPIVGVTLKVPILYQMASFMFPIKKKHYKDLGFMMIFFTWYSVIFSYLTGWKGMLLHYWISRNIVSQIFTWFAIASHLQLEPKYDPPEGYAWFEIQLLNTVNLGTSYFSDWLTGYQNWQIEHHLWPHMPPENFRKMSPYVKEVCKKYDIPYLQHDTIYSFGNVLRMMRKSGLKWFEVVQHTLTGQ